MREEDRHYLLQAIGVGRRTMGATGENPAVGCVIVSRGSVVGIGWTQEDGRPHAETQALAMAGEKARGATVYVSLEPCSHHGRTPPCADALIAAGVARVVSTIEDPDPRVAGRGHDRLRDAGITVRTGLCAHEARRDLAGFLMRVCNQRPHVTLKLAVSADGRLAKRPGERTAITSPRSTAQVHLMRSRSDAIMIGANTVRIDDPSLTCRLAGLEHRSPIAVVMASRLNVPLSCRLVKRARQRPLWIVCAPGLTNAALENAGAVLLHSVADADGRIGIAGSLGELARRGIQRLMVEGGAMLAGQFLAAGLVDEAVVFTSPMILGPQGLAAPLPLSGLKAIEEEVLGDDCRSRYERV